MATRKPKLTPAQVGERLGIAFGKAISATGTGDLIFRGNYLDRIRPANKRLAKFSTADRRIAQRAMDRTVKRIEREVIDRATSRQFERDYGRPPTPPKAPKATKPRTVSVRAKPKTAGLTGSKSKGGGKLRSDAQLAKEFDALYGKAKSLPKGSKARATAQREVTKRMVAYNRKAKADGTAGSYTMTKLGSKTARELSRLADKLYAEARATTGKKAKAALGRKALAVMKAYNAKMRASGKGGERYDLTLNRQRAGVSDG